MREIKFRSWLGKNWNTPNTMNYFTLETLIELPEYQSTLGDFVMEYTGLKDKNGKEIYDGDLFPAGLGNLYKVAWNNEAAKFSTVVIRNSGKMIGIPKLSMQEVAELEIIGNIYENPELLK